MPRLLVAPPVPPPAPPPEPNPVPPAPVIAALSVVLVIIAALSYDALRDRDEIALVPTTTTAAPLAPLPTAPSTELEEVWRYDAGDDLAGTTAYDGTRLFGATGAGRVFALDAVTGREVWTVELGLSATADPAVAGGVVLVAATDAALDGTLVALDAASGVERWRRSYESGAPGEGPVAVAAAVPSGTPVNIAYLADRTLIAINVDSGEQRWSTVAGSAGPVNVGPATDGKRVYAATEGRESASLGAADAQSGAPVWSHELGGDLVDTPLISGAVVAVPYRDGGSGEADPTRVVGLEVASGREKWRASVRGAFPRSLGATGGRFLFATEEDAIVALDAATGREAWTADDFSQRPAVTVDGERDRVLVTALFLDVLDGTTGRHVGRVLTPDSTLFEQPIPPGAAGELVAHVGTGGVLTAYR